MKLRRLCVSAALAWAGTLTVWSGDETSGPGRRSTGRILLTDTPTSDILFDSPDTSSEYALREDAANRVLGFVSEYGDVGSPSRDLFVPNANFLLLFANFLEREIHEDPFYLFGKEEVTQREFPYEEQAWNAFGRALRAKYQFVRAADQAIRKVQAATTLSYQAKSGVTVKVQPAIEDITDSNKIRLRVACLRLGMVDKIETKVGQNDIKVTIGKNAIFMGRLTVMQMIYEGRQLEEKEASFEHLGELTLSIPFW